MQDKLRFILTDLVVSVFSLKSEAPLDTQRSCLVFLDALATRSPAWLLKTDAISQHFKAFGGPHFLARIEGWKGHEWSKQALGIMFHLFSTLASSKSQPEALKLWTELATSLFSTPLGDDYSDEMKIIFVDKVSVDFLDTGAPKLTLTSSSPQSITSSALLSDLETRVLTLFWARLWESSP